jgi:multidrug resistance efflux pump
VTTLLSGVNGKASAEAQQQLAALQQQVAQQGAAIKELKAQSADKAQLDTQVRGAEGGGELILHPAAM